MTPQASDVPPLDGPDHRGDDLCRFSWDTQIRDGEDSLGNRVSAGIGASPSGAAGADALREAYAALDALLARLALLEDVARAAREEHGDPGRDDSQQDCPTCIALARLDAEGSR
jgi:hypothetical protein